MIIPTLSQKIAEAMKAHDAVKLSTLKLLLSALNYEKIDKQHDLSEEEELVVVRREAKMRKDAIEIYEKAGASERAEKEKQELVILEEYLPTQMSDEELEKLVDEAIKELKPIGMQDMGRVIGQVVSKAGGNVEGGKVAELVKNKLS